MDQYVSWRQPNYQQTEFADYNPPANDADGKRTIFRSLHQGQALAATTREALSF